MADGIELAKAYVQIIPSAKGIKGSLTSALDQPAQAAGKAAGNSIASGIKSSIGTVGKIAAGAMTAATTAAVVFGKKAVAAGKEFDASMSQVAATMGVSIDQITDLRDFAQEMGSTTVFSATEAADALNYMALAGYDAEKSMQMLPNVLNLAAAGGIELARASDMITDAESALGLSTEDVTAMVDQMAKTASSSNTSVEQLGEAILTIGATAQTMAGGTDRLNSVLGILANNGIKGAEAGTHLRNMLLNLSAPSTAGADALRKLGVSVFDADGKMRDFEDIFSDLNKSFGNVNPMIERAYADLSALSEKDLAKMFKKGDEQLTQFGISMVDADGKLRSLEDILKEAGETFENNALTDEYKIGMLSDIFNARDIASVNALLNTTVSDWDELAGKIVDSKDAADAMAKTQLDNLAGDTTLFKSALEGAYIAVSDKLTPSLRGIVQFGSKGLSEMTEAFNDKGFEGAISVLNSMLKTAVTKIVEFLPQLVTVGGELFHSVLDGIMAALPTLIAALPQFIATFISLFKDIGFAIVEIIPQLIQTIAEALPTLIPQIIDGIVSLMVMLANGYAEIVEPIVAALPDILTALVTALFTNLPILIDAIVNLVQTIVENLPAILQAIWDAIVLAWDGWIAPALEKVGEFFADVWQSIVDFFAPIVEWIDTNIIQPIAGFFTGLWEGISSAVETTCEWIKNTWETVKNWIDEKIIQPLSSFFKGLWEGIVNAWNTVIGPWIEIAKRLWDKIREGASEAWEKIKAIWAVVSGWFNTKIIVPVKNFFTNLWNGIKKAASTAWTGIKNIWTVVSTWFNQKIITPVKNVFTNMWNFLKNGATKAWQGIKNVFTPIVNWFKNIFKNAWEGVKNVFSTGGRIFSGIKEGLEKTFTTVVNGIIKGINTVVAAPFNTINWIFDKLRGISILGVSPFSWLGSISVPQIPLLAKGGILTGPTLMVGGEDGREAIVPLERNTEWIRAVAVEMDEATNGSELDVLEDILDKLDNMRIYLDGGKLVGGISGRMDGALGDNAGMKKRGVALA